MKTGPSRRLRSALFVVLSFCVTSFACAQTPARDLPGFRDAEALVLPPSVPDPFEPLNRTVWAFNKAVMTGVIKPTSKAYRFVVVKPR